MSRRRGFETNQYTARCVGAFSLGGVGLVTVIKLVLRAPGVYWVCVEQPLTQLDYHVRSLQQGVKVDGMLLLEWPKDFGPSMVDGSTACASVSRFPLPPLLELTVEEHPADAERIPLVAGITTGSPAERR